MDYLTQIPTSAPPHGVSSNFRNPVSQAKAIKGITTILMVLMSLSFVMRMYSRLWIKRTFKMDDCKSFPIIFGIHLRSHSCVFISRGW